MCHVKLLRSAAAMCGLLAAGAAQADAEPLFQFRDVGDSAGLFPHVAGIAGHGAGWGDVNGDGWPDLYVGTFGGHPYGSKPNMFFRNREGRFVLDSQEPLQVLGRANGAVFVDLDNDGDLDLYITNHAIAGRKDGTEHYSEPNHLFRNEGGGRFTDVSEGSGACPRENAARSVAVLDYDGDGLLDLLVGECFFQGGESRSRLYRNLGGLKFENATQAAGLPEQVTGFGVAAGDVNGDGRPDVFLAGRHRGNRLFLNDGHARFTELPRERGEFAFTYNDTPDDTACGVCFGDVNRDGLTDIVIGSHFDRPWFTGGVPVRLYVNRGIEHGLPRFEDVTERTGLVPLPMKCPHVEVQDFDNDGLPDIYTSIVKFADGRPHPVIFKNLGIEHGLPRFREGALAVNDFPTEEDRRIAGSGEFFAKMEREHKIVYTAPGPSGDFDRDGRLDLFLPNWWVAQRSLLLRNETPGGRWLDVAVAGGGDVNRDGIGSLVRVYRPGGMGDPHALFGVREIAVGYGYASGQEAVAHFGLGELEECDLAVDLPFGRGRIELRGVQANQRLTVRRPD